MFLINRLYLNMTKTSNWMIIDVVSSGGIQGDKIATEGVL